jgi:hypothetical protein
MLDQSVPLPHHSGDLPRRSSMFLIGADFRDLRGAGIETVAPVGGVDAVRGAGRDDPGRLGSVAPCVE